MSALNSKLFNGLVVPLSFVTSLIGGVVLIKEYNGGRKCPSKEKMDGKVCIITGANSGIGKCTAQELARRGAVVVMGCRHMGKCEKAAREIRKATENSNVVCRFLDLASLDTVEEFAQNVRNELAHIDVLINNAGVMKPRAPFTTQRTSDNFERQFGVNYLGHFLLTNLLLDKLTNGSSPGRVINVSSDAYVKGQIDLQDLDKSSIEEQGDMKLTELYYQSKLAVMLFTDALRKLSDTSGQLPGLTANSLNPGVSSTNIGRHSQAPAYAIGMHLYKPFQWLAMKTPAQGAQTSIYLAVDPELKNISGFYFDDCTEVFKICEKCDTNLADKLWTMSEKWTDLKERKKRIAENQSHSSEKAISPK